MAIIKLSLNLDKYRKTQQATQAPVQIGLVNPPKDLSYRGIHTYDQYGKEIEIDVDQRASVDKAISSHPFALTGAAGTGKTTVSQAILLGLKLHQASSINSIPYRIVGKGRYEHWPSVAIVAYSNKAVNNMRAKLQSHPELRDWVGANCTTIHNLLEYTRAKKLNEKSGEYTMQYFPTKNDNNKLEITHLVLEEASAVGAGANTIYSQLYAALPANIQIIFLGDINQIQSIGGKPVLGYAMCKLPVIKLGTIHRQALDNPIIAQAYRVLEGKSVLEDIRNGVGVKLLTGKSKDGRVTKFSVHHMLAALERKIPELITSGHYNPAIDMWLCPFNKSSKAAGNNANYREIFGTIDINAIIANYIAKTENRLVYEIKTGFSNIYLAVGDRVAVDKLDGIVLAIEPNNRYTGSYPAKPSHTLDYYGHDPAAHEHMFDPIEAIFSRLDYARNSNRLTGLLAGEVLAETSRQASHRVTIQLIDENDTVTLNTAGDFGSQIFSLGYALSVHKALGSEWPNVFVVLHDCHAVMLYREMLYTAMTRPRECLTIIAQEHVLNRAINNPRIKGRTLEDKIEYFKSGYLDQEVPLIPTGE